MTDFLLPFIVLSLIAVIIIQSVERYFFSKQVNRERQDALKFIISKNMREYSEIARLDKLDLNKPPEPPENVELSEASDEEFQKYIENNH